jgi:nucleoside-diphosphate-sugar epimerase
VDKIKRELDFEATVSLEQGLRELICWRQAVRRQVEVVA